MLFTNGFSCATDADVKEVVIKFLMQEPEFGQDGTVERVDVQEVTKLIMSEKTARMLAEALADLLEE